MNRERDDASLPAQPKAAVVEAARAFARLGFIHAFGHVSVRAPEGLWITPTSPPPGLQQPAMLLRVDASGQVCDGEPAGRPIEVFLHAAVYAARPDVGAICRTHAPAAARRSLFAGVPAVRHGFGGLAGAVARTARSDLVFDPASGAAVAADLAGASALLLRGNGALTVGVDVGEAAARMWGLEELCRTDMEAGAAPALSADELAARSRWYDAERKRVWSWLRSLAAAP